MYSVVSIKKHYCVVYFEEDTVLPHLYHNLSILIAGNGAHTLVSKYCESGVGDNFGFATMIQLKYIQWEGGQVLILLNK